MMSLVGCHQATDSTANLLGRSGPLNARAVEFPLRPQYEPDLKEMNIDKLRTNCINEIEHGLLATSKEIKVKDFKLLAWYRMVDRRPWHVDNGLCWAKVSVGERTEWVLVHMARNPIRIRSEYDQQWHSYFVFDVPNSWFLFFDSPPTNKDVYSKMTFFRFGPQKNWTVYDSRILEDAWGVAIGERPSKRGFPDRTPRCPGDWSNFRALNLAAVPLCSWRLGGRQCIDCK